MAFYAFFSYFYRKCYHATLGAMLQEIVQEEEDYFTKDKDSRRYMNIGKNISFPKKDT